MRNALLLLAVGAFPLYGNAQGFANFNLYQVGSSSFDIPQLGQHALHANSLYWGGRVVKTDKYFLGADCSVLLRMLANSGGTREQFLFSDGTGAQGMDLPAFSWRFGAMAKRIGVGVEIDSRALFIQGPADSTMAPTGYYTFNSDKLISDANIGLIVMGYFKLGDLVSINPTIGYDWMFMDREAEPVDGRLILAELPVQVWLTNGFGLNVEPAFQLRSLKVHDAGEKRTSTMFALKFGLAFKLR